MSKKNNYNSIVFLTTLSVYLGLVLVGATPSILAQAALTKDFDIKNEIVFEDDLDKKPDDEIKNLAGSIEDYFEELEDFIQDLQKLQSIGKFDLNYHDFKVTQKTFIPCFVNGDPIATNFNSKDIDNIWLEPAIMEAVYRFEDWINFSDCLTNDKFGESKVKNRGIEINYDKSDLVIKLSADKETSKKAAQLAENLNQAVKLYEVDDEEIIVKELYLNTTFSSENNQVFIVTRLPRGSLDTLLTTKDAQ